MVEDGLAEIVGAVDVALCQHVLPFAAGRVGTRSGPTLSAADSMRIRVHGRGAHGSMPQAAVDPVVLAAMIVVRLQTVVSRETRPGDPAVLTVGSLQVGTKSNVIPDEATILLNIRTYSEQTRMAVLDAIRRIVTAQCDASRSPKPADFELFDRFPVTDNDPEVTARVAAAFSDHFGDRAGELPLQTASEDFSDIPRALGVPYTYWGIGGIDAEVYKRAETSGRVSETFRSTTPRSSHPCCNPPSRPGLRRWSSRRWPGSEAPRVCEYPGQPGARASVWMTGMFAFALNGALTALHVVRPDIIEAITLGMITALGGATVRDIMIEDLPPATFSDWPYLAVAAFGSLNVQRAGIYGVPAAVWAAAVFFGIRMDM